ncbi:MAG: hypothetical protein Q9198_009168, partial [Flavoplaca austrocitrina]
IDSLSEAEIYTIFGRPKCQFFTGICGCDLCSRMGNYIVQLIDMARIDDEYISNDIVLIDYGFSFHLNKPPAWKWGMDRNFAPEIAFEGRFSKTSDIWALGCIIYELFTGRLESRRKGVQIINIQFSRLPEAVEVGMQDRQRQPVRIGSITPPSTIETRCSGIDGVFGKYAVLLYSSAHFS